jgi:multiple antibiotic resistance protein
VHLTLLRFALTAFTTLFVVIDPPGLVPVFFAMTNAMAAPDRNRVFRRSLLIAFWVALFFLIAGRYLLSQIGVSANAFKISGGILLFLTALPMLFGHRAGLMAPGKDEGDISDGDIAVFPLAIPLVSGPGTLTTVLTLDSAAQGSGGKQAALIFALVVVFAVTAASLKIGSAILAKLGASGANIVTRVFGIILAALAAQFVLNGVEGFWKGL